MINTLQTDSETILERSKGVFFAHWGELLRLRRVVLKSYNQDDIHDLRVASRRFRAALELFESVVLPPKKTDLKTSLRKLTSNLGGLRKIDKAILFFEMRNKMPHPSANLQGMLTTLRTKELIRIKKTLRDFDYQDLDCKVRDLIERLNEKFILKQNRFSLLAYFSDVSIRKYLSIYKLLNASTIPNNRLSRHSLRISIRKWRYFFELIEQVLDHDYSSHLELLKEYQSILGRMNDIVEFEHLLSKLELPFDEQNHIEKILKDEDTLLLENYTSLVKRNPLTYTFLI